MYYQEHLNINIKTMNDNKNKSEVVCRKQSKSYDFKRYLIANFINT